MTFPYYTAEPLSDRVTVIRSASQELLYLVEGSERAILIDTCCGVGHLRSFMEGLTRKPITVVLTHGHVDHSLGAPEFDEVWMHPADLPVYEAMSPMPVRQEYLQMGLGERYSELTEADFVPPAPLRFHPLTDRTVLEAGGISVEALHFPGHTPGMTAILIPEERMLIVGDGANQRTFMFDENSVPLAEYRENVARLKERSTGRWDRLFISHVTPEVTPQLLDEALETCDAVLAGHSDAIPFEFLGHHALIAHAFDESTGQRLDGGTFNLVYNPARLTA